MKLGFLFYERALVTGVSLAADMLSSAAQLREREARKADPMQIQLIGIDNEPLLQQSGLKLQADVCMSACQQLDLLILPPMWGKPQPVLSKYPQVSDWLIRQYQGGADIMATGTGVCWLAQSGLLDEQVATTHWYFFDKFSELYPKVRLNRQATVTEANGLYCTGSINSQTEMVLYFIHQLFGAKVTKVIEQHFSHEISFEGELPFYREGGQLQFDESIAFSLDWINNNLSSDLTAKHLAQISKLSLRTFNRKFKQQVGESPNQYVQKKRIQEAQKLLRDLSLAMGDIAHLTGYKNASYFSQAFKAHLDMLPSEYRAMVRAKGFS